MGPTASGKSQLALQLAEVLPVQIISVDSALVYRGMNIGTAKPSPAELARVPHYLIDICDPNEPYSAGQFCQDALQCISHIQQQDALPILVLMQDGKTIASQKLPSISGKAGARSGARNGCIC